MLASKKKLVLIIMIIFIMSFVSVGLFAECDMFGMLSTFGYQIHELQPITGFGDKDPYDYIWFENDSSFLYYQIGQNENGYGVIYYNNGDDSIQELDLTDPDNQVFRSEAEPPNYTPDYTAYNEAKAHIYNQAPYEQNATIVLGHARQASSGSSVIPDPHPFVWDYELTSDPDVPCYTFEHNGTITPTHVTSIRGWLGTQWESSYPYTTSPDLVDSEVYFHWIVYNIKECNGNVMLGLHNAITAMEGWGDVKNFVFSDGNALYAFRDYGSSSQYDYYLGYYDGLEEDDNPFRSVRTDYYEDPNGLETISLDELVYIPRQGDIMRYENFNNTGHEISGIVSDTWSSNNSPYYVIGDIVVNNELTIESGVDVFFLDECEFAINGQVTLEEGATFNLSHSSEVVIENDGLLTLDWGSTLTGFTPSTVEPTPPGQPIGGETIIPGDRIIAKNGGRITTDIPGELQPDDPVVIISSSSGIQWDGIFIQNPSDEDDFWFVNCDISGIRKLSIENISETETIANLKLHLTDFHDAGQIVVRDGHKLSVEGIASDLCYFQNTPAYPIYSYESSVDLNYIHIGGLVEDDGLENGGGVYLYESSNTNSKINNSTIMFNTGDGVKPNCVSFEEFQNNTIEENSGFGMMCYDGTIFDDDEFSNLLIRNNGYAEYAGWQQTFSMGDYEAGIIIADSDYGIGSDYYLLMNLNWDEQNAVDIRGTNITSVDHLYPTNSNAWTYSPQITGAKELLNSASIDFANEDYESAQQTLHLLLSNYLSSPEAIAAVYYLYHIENISTKDFTGLRDYLISLDVGESMNLYDTIKKVSAKTLMKEKDYILAIEELEDIIINSELPDEVISAMIDQGYCYLELADEGERGLPENCTVKTATLDEYQAKVRELESQFSFYPNENNQENTPIAGDILSLSNYPNPFNPTTTIAFDLATKSNVSIAVYNVKGQKVKQLMNEQLSVGQHSIEWNGKDSNNKAIASGIYFYKISAGKSTSMRKMLLLK